MSEESILQKAGSDFAAIEIIAKEGQRNVGYHKPPSSGMACLALLGVLALTVSPTVPMVTRPSATVTQTVSAPSETVYWVSTARGSRAKIHVKTCRYHRVQTDTAGASKRQYYPTIEAAAEAHPKCSRCRVCLGVPSGLD